LGMGEKKYGPACDQPILSFFGVRLPLRFYLAVTIAAVNRTALSGLKGDGSRLAAVRTGSGERLAGGGAIGTVAGIAIASAPGGAAVCLACLTAFGAAFGLIGIAPLLELLLFRYSEGEGIVAIGTAEGFVLKTHVGWPPLLNI
jgi:hypothetical protein